MSPRRHFAALRLGLILCGYLALAIANSVIIPPFHWPDEIGHFFAIKYIVDFRQLPIPDPDLARHQYYYAQQGTQPPLYYGIGALLVRLGRLDTTDAWAFDTAPRNPYTICGSPRQAGDSVLEGNGALWAYDPIQNDGILPWTRSTLALHLLRLLSVGLGLATVIGVHAIARLVFPARPAVAVLAAALTAFNPQFLFVSAMVSNDNLLVALCTWVLVLVVRMAARGPAPAGSALTGLLSGLAVLTKLTGVLLLPLAWLAIMWAVWKQRRAFRAGLLHALGHALWVALLALAVSGWWYVRNWLLYGDPVLIRYHLAVVGGRGSEPFLSTLSEVPGALRSYWASFVCAISPGPWYAVFWGMAVVAGLVGLALRWRRVWRDGQRGSAPGLIVLGIWFALVFIGWLRWNALATGVQGRLLFPAAASASILVGAGWVALTSGRLRWLRVVLVLAWAGVACWVLVALFYPAFAAPARYASVDAVDIPQRVDGVFGDSVVLLGYDVHPGSLEPGDTVTVKLYLTSSRPLTIPYAMGLWFISAVPGAEQRLTGLDTWPGRGNYPTIFWRPGEVLVDTYHLRVPERVARAQGWVLQVTFGAPGAEAPLPLSVGGQVAGDRALLGWVRAGASEQQAVPPDARLDVAPVFGEAIALRGTQIQQASDEVAVTLWWEALVQPEEAYTVFVHLVDEDGQLFATGDGPPLEGGFPTQMWRPGDRVEDTHVIALPADPEVGAYCVQVGWYDPLSGARLQTGVGSDHYTIPQTACIETHAASSWTGDLKRARMAGHAEEAHLAAPYALFAQRIARANTGKWANFALFRGDGRAFPSQHGPLSGGGQPAAGPAGH